MKSFHFRTEEEFAESADLDEMKVGDTVIIDSFGELADNVVIEATEAGVHLIDRDGYDLMQFDPKYAQFVRDRYKMREDGGLDIVLNDGTRRRWT